MPGPDWRDVQRRAASPRAPAAAAPAPARAGPRIPANLPVSPPLARLFAEREALEQRMHRLTGAPEDDPRLAALYRVQPMAERRAEHDAWQAQRQEEARRLAAEAVKRRGAHPEPDGRPQARSSEPGDRHSPELRPLPAAGRSLPLRPTAADLAPPLRPTAGERPRTAHGGTPSDSRGFMAIRDKSGALRRDLAEADRRLAEEGLESERADLGRATEQLKLDRIDAGAAKLDRVFDRGTSIADSPGRAGRLVKEDWRRRRDRTGGPDLDSYQRGYKERAARLLNVDTGTIEELQERTERQREASLDRRRDARDGEERDQARRARALERRQGTRDER